MTSDTIPETIPLPKPIKTESRVAFGLAWFATEAEADTFATFIRARGDSYNGGFYPGTPCGRAPIFDTTIDGKPAYAVTVR